MKKLLLFFALLLAIANPYTQSWIAARFVVDDGLEPAEAVVPLRGDPEEERPRVEEAARLVREGYAPLLVVSADARPYYGRPPRSLIEDYLKRQKFPTQKLRFCENAADSTAEEASAIRACLVQENISKATIVTSEYHTRRARAIFRNAFAESEIQVRVHPVYNGRFWDTHWWQQRRWAKTYLREALAMIWSFLERWSTRESRAAQPPPQAAAE